MLSMLIENSSTTKAKMMGGVPERQVLGRNGRRPQERVVQPAATSCRSLLHFDFKRRDPPRFS